MPLPPEATSTPAPTGPPNLLQRSLRSLGRALSKLGIDQAIAYTVLARGWAATAGLVTVALIARSLSPFEQGYYYTFGSLVAMQLIFELGFSVVILQLATHEAAHLSLSLDGHISGPPLPHARLASILRKSLKWYTVASLLMAAIVIPAGWHFFSANPDPAHPVAWRLPWCFVVLASTITFQLDPIFSFLEGCGQVARVARARFSQSILGSILAWSALLLHHGLFAPALLISGQAIAGIFFLSRRRRLLSGLLRHPVGTSHIDWRQEVWPFQWRIAVSYASGFLIFQLFNPVLFHYWGPTVAGRMGMSINISNAIASVAIAWINTKAAPFGTLIARRDFTQLDSIFFRSLRQSLLLSLTGSCVVWMAAVLLGRFNLPFAHRILPPLPFGLLLLSMNINQVVASMALYLRAHKQEKFLLNSVIGAICVSISTLLLGRAFGALGITIGQFAIAVAVGLGFGTYTFLKYRRIWHAA